MNPRSMLNWFISPSFDNYNMSEYDTINVAKMICGLKRDERPLPTGDYESIYVPKIDIGLYRGSDFLEPVAEVSDILDSEMPSCIKHFLLHGSLVDFKYIKGWSDLDSWVVIDDSVFDNADALVKLRKLFHRLNKHLLRIDSIAHHGFIAILESDLGNYTDSFLPIEVLSTARSLYGKSDITIQKSGIRSDWTKRLGDIKDIFVDFNATGVFKHHPYENKYLTENMIECGEGMYQLKYLIGLVLSFPILYYSALGSPVYKADSFDTFLDDFPTAVPLINGFSNIRSSWEKMEQYPYTPNHIPGWLVDSLPSNYVSRAIELLDDMIIQVNTLTIGN